MAKPRSGVGIKADKAGEPKLKGLERRTREGRRDTPRRKSDSTAAGAGQAVAEPERLSLAVEAGALVARYYQELFSLFPEVLTASRKSDTDDRHRKSAAALELIVNVLRKQDDRVKALKELELKYRDDPAQTDHYGAIAEIMLGLMTEFSDDCWTDAIEQFRGASGTIRLQDRE